MKLIASYDAAIQNLGVCYIEFDDEWRYKVDKYVTELHTLYDNMDELSPEDFIKKAVDIITHVNAFLDQIITIKFFNVIDLIPGAKATSVPMLERTKRLKYLLKSIDQRMPSPDIVLIEYQMKQNDISRTISNQIAMHYIDEGDNVLIEYNAHVADRKSLVGSAKDEKSLVNNSITYAVEKYSLLPVLLSGTGRIGTRNSFSYKRPPKIVELVGPTLKNSISLMPGGDYGNFIVMYSNYVANKHHTEANFAHYAEVYNIDLSNINNKLDDIADGFMMTMAWLKKKNMI
jgi:hypothetical protein